MLARCCCCYAVLCSLPPYLDCTISKLPKYSHRYPLFPLGSAFRFRLSSPPSLLSQTIHLLYFLASRVTSPRIASRLPRPATILPPDASSSRLDNQKSVPPYDTTGQSLSYPTRGNRKRQGGTPRRPWLVGHRCPPAYWLQRLAPSPRLLDPSPPTADEAPRDVSPLQTESRDMKTRVPRPSYPGQHTNRLTRFPGPRYHPASRASTHASTHALTHTSTSTPTSTRHPPWPTLPGLSRPLTCRRACVPRCRAARSPTRPRCRWHPTTAAGRAMETATW